MKFSSGKPGIRAFGVAESFRKGQKHSVLAGVVMRADLVVDGVAFGRTKVGGDDASSSVIRLYRKLGRNDVNLLMISGAVLSFYNIVDPVLIHQKTHLPVVCLTYKETSGIEDSIRRHFPDSHAKIESYRGLGPRTRVKLSSGGTLYVRKEGIDQDELRRVLDRFTLQGSVPEPVRLAKIMARGLLRGPRP